MMGTNDTAPEIFSAKTERYFTINAGRPFLRDLAAGVSSALNNDPIAISDTLVLVPTRRAARALNHAFHDLAAEHNINAVLPPQIKPLGDVDENELTLFAGDTADEIDLPPAVSTMERKLILAQMVAAKDRAFAGQANWPAALSAAGELAKLLDSFYTEEINFEKLADLVPEQYADHWGQSLKFLEIVTEMWPAHLEMQGRTDPSDRRAKLIDAQQRRWATTTPAHPVIVAGTTGSAPSVARLMKTVAAFDRGAVVLPGLDLALVGERGWEEMDDAHPQAGLKALLNALQVTPQTVEPWPQSTDEHERSRLLSLALRPAAATDDWRRMVDAANQTDPALRKATEGMTLVDAADEEIEAGAIAIAMRETLETPGATAMLVTPDRDLSRRVAAKMRRWNILVDDSAGIPFHNSPCGTYLRLAAEWLNDRSNPVAMIAFARHPLAFFGCDGGKAAKAVDALDLLLRGLAPSGGDMAAVRAKIRTQAQERTTAIAEDIIKAFEKAEDLWSDSKDAPFEDCLDGHLHIAELLAGSHDLSGAERLWRGEDGETGAKLIAELREATHSIEAPGSDYPAIFTQLISGATVRRRAPTHPRLSILGPLEARLQTADRVILGGLNEGNWPADAMIDPFLSRPMRVEIGLPSPERRIGLSAHDFAQLAAGREVILTRAARAGGKPTKPSRWLLRLQNVLNGADAPEAIDATERYAFLTKVLDEAGEAVGAKQPNVRPPLAARPKELYVTRISQLLRDPYGVYARHVLKLKKNDPLGEAFSAKHLGNLFHTVFEIFAGTHAEEMPENPDEVLSQLFEETAPDFGYGNTQHAFWQAEVNETIAWFAGFHQQRLELGAPAVIEDEGALTMEIGGEEFTLRARADRIDMATGGGIDVFDYKSKTMPSFEQIKSAFNPQLPLTALIAEQGGFDTLKAGAINSFYYLRFLQRRATAKPEIGAEGLEAKEAVRDADEGLRKIIAHYNNPQTAYLSQPRPEFTDDFGDYDHLARRREWRAEEEGV